MSAVLTAGVCFLKCGESLSVPAKKNYSSLTRQLACHVVLSKGASSGSAAITFFSCSNLLSMRSHFLIRIRLELNKCKNSQVGKRNKLKKRLFNISVIRFKSVSDSKIDSFLSYCTYCMNKGLEVKICFSCSPQLSMKFQMLIKMLKIDFRLLSNYAYNQDFS